MKKRILFMIIIGIILFGLVIFSLNRKEDTNLKTIKVSEVTHSVFYTPWYVALNNGYFEEEGLNIEVVLTPGADKVMASLLSNDAQIGLSGPEATIYIKEGNSKDYIINFASLTKRDGQFLFGNCNEKDNFKISNLNNKHILVGRNKGMPSMVFNYAIRNSNIKNLDIDYSVEFASLSSAYISGIADYVNLFENNVTIRKGKRLNSFTFIFIC